MSDSSSGLEGNEQISWNVMKYYFETILDLSDLASKKKRQKRVEMELKYISTVVLLLCWLHWIWRKLSKLSNRRIVELKTIGQSFGYALYLCDIGNKIFHTVFVFILCSTFNISSCHHVIVSSFHHQLTKWLTNHIRTYRSAADK